MSLLARQTFGFLRTFFSIERILKDIERIEKDLDELEVSMAKNFDILRGEHETTRDKLDTLYSTIGVHKKSRPE